MSNVSDGVWETRAGAGDVPRPCYLPEGGQKLNRHVGNYGKGKIIARSEVRDGTLRK
jgi:hypothetical protein